MRVSAALHRGVGVGLGPPDRLVRLGACLADGLVGLTAGAGDGLVGFLADGLPGCLVLDDAVPELGPGRAGVGAGSFRVGLGRFGLPGHRLGHLPGFAGMRLGSDPGRLLPRGQGLGRLPGVVGVGDLRGDLRGGRVGVGRGGQGLGQVLGGLPERGGELLGPVQGAACGPDRLGDRRAPGLGILVGRHAGGAGLGPPGVQRVVHRLPGFVCLFAVHRRRAPGAAPRRGRPGAPLPVLVLPPARRRRGRRCGFL